MDGMKRVAGAAILAVFLVAGLGVGSARAEKRIGIVMFSEEKRYHEARDAAKAAIGKKEPGAQYVEENAGGNKAKAAEIAKKVAAAKYDLVLVVGTSAATAVAGAVKDVPVVFTMVYDPVDSKIAKDWSSSGNNTTGSSPRVPMPLLLENLKKLRPVKTLGVVYTPGEKNSESQLKELQAAQAGAGLKVLPIPVASTAEINTVVADAAGKIEALYLTGSSVVGENLPVLLSLAARGKVVTLSHLDDMVERGALFGVAANSEAVGRLAGEKAAKILGGAAPASLPIEMLASFDVILNQKTVAETGVTVPDEFRKLVTRTVQ
jgi:putative ABC transport system substrate-binding protein